MSSLVLEDGHVLALCSHDVLVIVEVARRVVARGDVVGQDVKQGGLVCGLEEIAEEVCGELGEGLVGGRKHGQWARASKNASDASSSDGRNEGGELGNRLGELEEVGERSGHLIAELLCAPLGCLGDQDSHLGVRDEHSVDDVNDAVGCVHVGLDDRGVSVDKDLSASDDKDEGLAVEGEGLLEVCDLIGVETSTAAVAASIDDVVREDRVELLGVRQEVGEDARWEVSKGVVVRRKDSEGAARVGESLDEVAGLDCSDKGGESRDRDGRGDNVVLGVVKVSRHEDSVDDVDNAVCAEDVGPDDLGVVDGDGAVGDVGSDGLAGIHRGDDLAVLDLVRGHGARNDVVGEDSVKCLDVVRVEDIVCYGKENVYMI